MGSLISGEFNIYNQNVGVKDFIIDFNDGLLLK